MNNNNRLKAFIFTLFCLSTCYVKAEKIKEWIVGEKKVTLYVGSGFDNKENLKMKTIPLFVVVDFGKVKFHKFGCSALLAGLLIETVAVGKQDHMQEVDKSLRVGYSKGLVCIGYYSAFKGDKDSPKFIYLEDRIALEIAQTILDYYTAAIKKRELAIPPKKIKPRPKLLTLEISS